MGEMSERLQGRSPTMTARVEFLKTLDMKPRPAWIVSWCWD
jgi:hypothetical protein